MKINGSQLLSRNIFRIAVFNRDRDTCVVPDCNKVAEDAHHIMERKLFPDGGYYADNGASLCEAHHIEAEATTISAQQLREWCGIQRVILPPTWSENKIYDKWGNVILDTGYRIAGPLFNDPSTRKILAQGNALGLFIDWEPHQWATPQP